MEFKTITSAVVLLCLISWTIAEDIDDTTVSKRAAAGDLQDFRDRILINLNQYRRRHSLPEFEADDGLEKGAQGWAESEMRVMSMSHSCDYCPDFSEILAKRRASRPLPQGAAAGEWVYNSWFGQEDNIYSVIVDNPEIHKVGFGIAYVRDPRDRTFHMYAVGRFSRRSQRG